jgi:hypothetical protein
MVEEARKHSQTMPKGRVMLRRIFAEFDLERQRGGMVSHQQLLNVRLGGNALSDLETLRDRILFIRAAMEDDDLPKQATLESFIYQQLKHHPKMGTAIEKYESSKLDSHRRSYEWLWKKMNDIITRHKVDHNVTVFDKALASGKTTRAAGAPANVDDSKSEKKDKKRGKRGGKKKNKGESEDVPAAPAPGKTTPPPKRDVSPGGKGKKGKGKDYTPRGTDNGNTTPRGTPLTAEQKAKLPCMFYAFKSCHAGGKCAFLHDDNNLYSGPPPRAVKGKGKGTPKAPGAVAAVLAAGALPVAQGVEDTVTEHGGWSSKMVERMFAGVATVVNTSETQQFLRRFPWTGR